MDKEKIRVEIQTRNDERNNINELLDKYKYELIDRVDNSTYDINDKIQNYFWTKHNIELDEYYPNNDDNGTSASDEIYTIIHNALSEIKKEI